MKRLISVVLAVLTVSVLCFVFASAEDSYTLFPEKISWQYTENGGCKVDINNDGSKVVISGSVPGTWPAATGYYTDPVTVPVDGSKISFDFTVEGTDAAAGTNITFYFSSPDKAEAFAYPISNNALNFSTIDAGSGDLKTGSYKGSIKLSDLVNSKTNLDSKAFDKSYVTADGKITFAGIQVYSVSGSVITVKKLEVVSTSEAENEPEESEAESEAEESASEETSAEASVEDESAEESNETAPEESAEASVEESESTENESDGFPVWAIILICCVVIAGAAGVIVAVTKKK